MNRPTHRTAAIGTLRHDLFELALQRAETRTVELIKAEQEIVQARYAVYGISNSLKRASARGGRSERG